jgi:hypothetical protein
LVEILEKKLRKCQFSLHNKGIMTLGTSMILNISCPIEAFKLSNVKFKTPRAKGKSPIVVVDTKKIGINIYEMKAYVVLDLNLTSHLETRNKIVELQVKVEVLE